MTVPVGEHCLPISMTHLGATAGTGGSQGGTTVGRTALARLPGPGTPDQRVCPSNKSVMTELSICWLESSFTSAAPFSRLSCMT
jgi:hypothetical protein